MTNERSTSAPIAISSQGLAERDQRALKLVIEFILGRDIPCRYLGDGNSSGHIVVVDLESEEGHDALTKLRPGQVKVLFSEERIVGKNIVTLIAPIKFEILKNVVIKICEQIKVQLDRRQKKRLEIEQTIQELSNEQEAVLNDGVSIFNVLFGAKKEKSYLKISPVNMPSLLVNGADGMLATDADEEELQKILSSSTIQLESEEVSSSDVPPVLQSAANVSLLEDALWLAGLSWHSGELLDDYSVDDIVKLKAWPNFTRNSFSPDHLKLSAALSSQAMSLRNLNAVTQVSLVEIIRFFNSCYAIDLVDVDVSDGCKEKVVIEKKNVNDKRRSLLFRLADRLGFG